MKDLVDRSYSDDAEFEDFDDADYMDDFLNDEDDESLDDLEDEYDDLEDMYADEDDAFSDEVMEIEVAFNCEDCGHKWSEYITEVDDENDFVDVPCPMCGSSNVSQE